MSISFKFFLNNIIIYGDSEESSDDLKAYLESDLSTFELGLVKFCHANDSEVSFFFGEKWILLDLWYDIYELVKHESSFAISALKNKRKMSFDFPKNRWEVSSQKYYDNKVQLKCWAYGGACDEYFIECNVDELINELIQLASNVISLAIKGGYVDRESSNKFLANLRIL